MNKELDKLKKQNKELEHKVAELIENRDREIYEMGVRLTMIMNVVYNFMKDYVSFADSEGLLNDRPGLYINTVKGDYEVGIRFNSFFYNPEEDTLYYQGDLVVPTIVEWTGRYEYVCSCSYLTKTANDETIKELYDELKRELEHDGKDWNERAKELVKLCLEKERNALRERIEKLS